MPCLLIDVSAAVVVNEVHSVLMRTRNFCVTCFGQGTPIMKKGVGFDAEPQFLSIFFLSCLLFGQGMPIMKSLSVVVMPTHMLPARAAPMAPGTMTAYFDQIEVRFTERLAGRC